MGNKYTRKNGFLLLEIGVTLSVFIISATVMSYYFSQIHTLYRADIMRSQALDIAQEVVQKVSRKEWGTGSVQKNCFTIEVQKKEKKVFLPDVFLQQPQYVMHEVNVYWYDPARTKKSIKLVSGVCHEPQ